MVYKFLSSLHGKYNSIVHIFNINTIKLVLGEENRPFSSFKAHMHNPRHRNNWRHNSNNCSAQLKISQRCKKLKKLMCWDHYLHRPFRANIYLEAIDLLSVLYRQPKLLVRFAVKAPKKPEQTWGGWGEGVKEWGE